MNRNPLFPFALIAVFGIILIVTFSIIGLNQSKDVAGSKEGEATEATASASPEEIYQQNCSSCHGQNYEGAVGPALKGVGEKISVDQIKETIKNGKGGVMPAFSGTLTDEQIAEMAQWVSKLK